MTGVMGGAGDRWQAGSMEAAMTEPTAHPTLDLRALAVRLRGARLRGALDGLAPGETLVLLSDREPEPLHRALEAERPGAFAWQAERPEPDVWRVLVQRRVAAPAPAGAAPRPAALAGTPPSQHVHVDVRDDVRRGEEPFGRIMAAVAGLGDGQVLVLRAPFEPVPLYAVLGRRGFAHFAERRAEADWTVFFYRDAPDAAPSPAAAGPTPAVPGRLDVRGLEPPQPMVRVLEAVERLRPGGTLEVLLERRPLFLYPQLDERGFTHRTDEPAPGVVRVVIRREAAP
jgi:uncharacterized protein (DUF2249 family)